MSIFEFLASFFRVSYPPQNFQEPEIILISEEEEKVIDNLDKSNNLEQKSISDSDNYSDNK